MEEEANLVAQDLTRTGPSSNESSNGDDAESWTILDEDPDDLTSDLQESALLQQVAAQVQEVAESTQGNDAPKYYDLFRGDVDTDSDIETIDERNLQIKTNSTGTEIFDSLGSDGIPVGDELSGERDQYIWSSDNEMNDSIETNTDELDSNFQKSDKMPDLSSQYPPEELPERFSQIQKGRTYIHNRNQKLNMVLSGVLVIVVAGALGLGIGNFLGWSSRIEIHEQFAEVQDERLEELTDSLVSCMTGPESQGGDDQDLDDRVIHHLSEENRRLKEELELVKDGKDSAVAEEMTVILRDRINDLLVANSDLEREVARLRYSHVQPVQPTPEPVENLEKTRSDLKLTKESLNEIAAENEQLKIAIGKARYGGPPPTPQEEKERIVQLQLENEELKSEVQKIRNSLSSQSEPTSTKLEEPEDASSSVLHLQQQQDVEVIPEPAEVIDITDSKIETSIPQGQLIANQIQEEIWSEDIDEGYVSDIESDNDVSLYDVIEEVSDTETEFDPESDLAEEEIENLTFELEEKNSLDDVKNQEPQSEEEIIEEPKKTETKKEDIGSIFKSATKLLKDWSKKIGRKDWSSLGSQEINKVLDKMKTLSQNIMPENAAEQISSLSQMMKDKGAEMKELFEKTIFRQSEKDSDSANFPEKMIGKFSKTLRGTLQRLSDILSDDISGKEDWEKRVHNLRENMERKWTGLKNKFDSFFRQEKQEEKKVSKSKREAQKKGDEGKLTKPKHDKTLKENPEKTQRKWSEKSKTVDQQKTNKKNETTSAQWIFARAQTREQTRKEESKSDWVFERAKAREKSHDSFGADWNTRRHLNKECEKNGEDAEACDQLDKLSFSSENRGKTARGDTLSFNSPKPDIVFTPKTKKADSFRRDIFAPKDHDDLHEEIDETILRKNQKLEFRDEFFAGGFAPKRPTGPKIESPKSDKRGRYHNHNSEKHYRKNRKAYIIDNVDFLNKFH